MLKNGGFKVKGWISNKELCKESQHEVESDTIKMLQSEDDEKVLGIAWTENQIHCHLKSNQI